MKRLLTISLAAALLLASAAGCSSKTVKRSEKGKGKTTSLKRTMVFETTYPPESYKPVVGRYGGRLVLANMGEPKSFNPITSSESSTRDYIGSMYRVLVEADPWTQEPIPALATEWSMDETGKVWTFKLRQDVTWSDGHPFTVDDLVFTYETIYDKSLACSMRDLITGPNGEQWQIDKIDDYTVKFTLFEKNAVFLQIMAGVFIIPKHKYEPLVDSGKFNEALGPNTDPNEIVGIGPFLLEKYEPGTKVILKRNPRYYQKDAAGNQLPYLDKIVFLLVPDWDMQILKFRQKEIDYTAKVRGQDFPILKPLEEKDNFTIYKLGPVEAYGFVFFNQNTGVNPQTGKPFVEPHKLKWFRDVRFRQAVSHATDREFMVNSIHNGLGYPQYGPRNRYGSSYWCNRDMPRYEYDLDKARALLKEMGMEDRDGDGFLEDSDGNVVAFNLTTNNGNNIRLRTAEVIRKNLAELGIKVNFRPMNFNILVSKLDATFDWEACVMGLYGSDDPHWGYSVWTSSGRMHQWFPRQETPSTEWEAELDRLFEAGSKELDREKRRAIYFRWQEIVGEQQPFIYTAARERMVALRNKFGNVFPAPGHGMVSSGIFHNIEEVFVLEGAD